jgi:hypothetical protein
MSGVLGADDLCVLKGFKAGGRNAARDIDGAVFERSAALSWPAVELRRGGRALGISEPHSRRFRERYNSEGAEGTIDRGRGEPMDRTAFVVE